MTMRITGAIQNRTRLAVVIPCYKVEPYIAAVIRSIPDYVSHIIVVDDASPDCCSDKVRELRDPRVTLVRHAHNKGVGGAMVTGYKECLKLNVDIAIKMDGDGQMDPTWIPTLIQPLLRGEADYAKGNRWHHEENLSSMPWLRRVGNLGLSFATKLASGYWKLFDPCNGYTAVRTSVLKRIRLDDLASDYFFETSMLVELSIRGAVTRDIPMPAIYGDETSSLRIGRIVRRFPRLLVQSFCRRVWQQYFVRNFDPTSLFLLAGTSLAGWGFLFGSFAWIRSLQTGIPATSGTVMLAAVPTLMGYHLLIQAAVLDISNQPTKALCSDEPLAEEFEVAAARSNLAA